MKAREFERLFNNFANKAQSKAVDYSSLTRDEKISHLHQVLEIDTTGIVISTEKEIEIEKLSKDVRFELIQKATQQQNIELICKLATGKGSANVICSLPFEKCSISSQLNFLETEYRNKYNELPNQVEVAILGGDNFYKFIEFCSNKITEMNANK